MKRRKESGFALLLVFLMAALIAISLYAQLPRVAFEAQRAKEQLLIDRGEQYKRAIQLYVRKFNRYPAKIEDLENSNNIRFLRHRYTDPMTGKDEWRLIRCGPGGVLLDSVNTKKDKKDDKAQSQNTFVGEGPVIGSTASTAQVPSAALRRRASDMPGQVPAQQAVGTPGMPPEGGMLSGQQGVPGQMPGVPGQTTGLSGVSGQPGVPVPGQPGAFPPGVPGQPQTTGTNTFVGGGSYVGGSTTAQTPGQVPGQVPGQFPGAPASSQAGGYPYPTTAGSQGTSPQFGQPGTQPLGNDATRMIQQILTSPRPTGASSSGIGTGTGIGGQQVIGGGIAGVASTLEQDSIKIYDERQKYNEWEFVYDQTKDRGGMGVNAAGRATGTGSQQQQQGGFNQQQGGFNQQQGGFNQQQGGFGQQPAVPGRRDD